MNIEKIIRDKRSLEYAVTKNDDKCAIVLYNNLLKTYYENLEQCNHHIYCDYGYYKYRNMDVYEVPKEDAEFRVLICPVCEHKITLLKTTNPNWDHSVLAQELQIVSPFELNLNDISTDILTPTIQSLLSSYFHMEQTYCHHLEFLNNGYYKIVNNQIEKSNPIDADFRIVTCNCCKKTYLLPKRENQYWDTSIDGKPITVLKAEYKANQKVFCK